MTQEQTSSSGNGNTTEARAKQHMYIAIDLKSFYASVECVDRGLDPLTTNLVVADPSRTEKTICLAVSPSLKACGISGRARLFEVIAQVKKVNAERAGKLTAGYFSQNTANPRKSPCSEEAVSVSEAKSFSDRNGTASAEPSCAGENVSVSAREPFTGTSWNATLLDKDPSLKLDYLVAVPRMAEYMKRSTEIYQVYLKYVAPEDIHVYSIDEVFIDITNYQQIYHMSPQALARKMIQDVLDTTGITATAGIGPNLYLCKVAMDIVAKHIEPDAYGVRIATLDELQYRRLLWNHQPLTDFWRVGRGYVKKLQQQGLYTMGDIARCSIGKSTDYYNEDLLYRLFGINAELLIDHAWGYEPCTIADIKAYKPEANSIGSGQVLSCATSHETARLILREMADLLALDLVAKGLVTDQITITVDFDRENLYDEKIRRSYHGPVTDDRYGRQVPKHAHGTKNLNPPTASSEKLMAAAAELYDTLVNPLLLVRRLYITANNVIPEKEVSKEETYEQLDLFTDYQALEKQKLEEAERQNRERKMQEAMLDIKKRFGKNAILKGMNLQEGATARDKNRQIGGHKA